MIAYHNFSKQILGKLNFLGSFRKIAVHLKWCVLWNSEELKNIHNVTAKTCVHLTASNFLGSMYADLCLVFIQRLSKLTQLIQGQSVHQQQNLKRKPKSYDYSTACNTFLYLIVHLLNNIFKILCIIYIKTGWMFYIKKKAPLHLNRENK